MAHKAIWGKKKKTLQNFKIIRKSKCYFSTHLFTYMSLDCHMSLGRRKYFHSKLLNTKKFYSKRSYNGKPDQRGSNSYQCTRLAEESSAFQHSTVNLWCSEVVLVAWTFFILHVLEATSEVQICYKIFVLNKFSLGIQWIL